MPDHAIEPNAHSLPQNIDSLTVLAASLKAALEAVAAFMPPGTPGIVAAMPGIEAAAPGNGAPQEGTEQPDQQGRQESIDAVGEVRSYRVPNYALEDEREYLRTTGAESSFDLMGRTLDRLRLLLTLIRHTAIPEEMTEDFVELLGEQLQDSLDMLERILSFFDELKPVNGEAGE